MPWKRVREHTEQIEMLRKAVARNRLAHGFLFLGPEGIGKRHVARTLVQTLFCRNSQTAFESCGECPACRQIQVGSHPDLLEIGCPAGKREIPIDLLVGARDRRGREGLCHDLALRPMSAERRAAIIDDAQCLNEESANALLKTLEEPPPGSIIILIAPDAEPLLPTIRSRCQPLWFSPLSTQAVTDLLQEEGVPTAAADEAARFSDGSLAAARTLLDPAVINVRNAVRAGLASIAADPLKVTAEVTAAIEQAGGDSSAHRAATRLAVQFTVDLLRERLKSASPASSESDLAGLDRAALCLDRCIDADLQLQQSMPAPLCLGGLFDDLSKIERTGRSAAL